MNARLAGLTRAVASPDARTRIAAMWRHPGFWIGWLATAVISIATIASPRAVENFATFGPFALVRRLLPQRLSDVLLFLALLALAGAFVLLRPTGPRGRVAYRLVFALWSLPLLICPPVLSDDVYLYLDEGWQLNNGYAPYSVGLGDAGGPYANAVFYYWRHSGAIYPPMAIEAQRLAVILGRDHLIPSVWAMRLIVLACCGVVALAIPYIARQLHMDSERAIYIALLNPLTIVHFVGGAHNDALMVAFAFVAFAVAFQRRPWWLLGAVLAGFAGLSKQPGLWAAVIVAMIAFPTARWWKRLLVTAISSAIAVGTFVGFSVLSGLGFGWIKGTLLPSSIATLSPGYIGSQVVLMLTQHNVWPLVSKLCYLPIALILGWLLLRRWRLPMTAAAGGWLAYAFLAPALHPWYILSALPFVGLLRLRPATAEIIKIASMYLLLGSWFVEASKTEVPLAAVVALFGALVLVWAWQAWHRRHPEASSLATVEPSQAVG